MTREEINEGKQKEIENEKRKETMKIIIKKMIKTIFIIMIIGIIFFSYTTYISTVKISVREYRIKNEKIPENFNGIKIIQFSDLHYGSTMYSENIKEIKKIINIRKPDLILFTGDLINHDYKITEKEKESLAIELSNLKATLGKYAVLGDEDNTEDITTILNQANFTTLKNEYDLIYTKTNNPILLIGLSSLIKKEQNIEKGYDYFHQETHNSNIFTITMVHEPDSSTDIINNYNNTDLILAGHSHNGSIRIPFANFPLERKEGAKKYNQEQYQINNTKLFISSGLGTNNSIGIRLFCRPSINFFRLSKN